MRHVLSSGQTLTAVMSGAAATTNPKIRASVNGSDNWVTLSGATAVTLATGQCTVESLSCNNIDTAAVTITLTQNGNTVSIVTLGVGYTLVSDDSGFYVLDTAGQITQASSLAQGSAQAFTSTVTTTDGVPSGTARRIGGIAFRSIVASTAQLGTVETRVVLDQSYTLPANSLKVGTVIEIEALVFHTSTTGSETHTLAVAMNATDLAVTGNLDPADNGASRIRFVVVVRSVGVSGTVVGWGTCDNGTRAAALTATHGLMTGTTSTSTQVIDTTIDQVIGIAIDRQASAGDTDSCRLDALVVRVSG